VRKKILGLVVLQRQVESNESPEVLQRPFTTRSRIYVRLQVTNWSLKRQFTLLLALAALTAIQNTAEAQHKSPELSRIEEKLIRSVEHRLQKASISLLI
jgi:hypothetical protein